MLKKNVDPLNNIVDARSVAFMDMDEDVRSLECCGCIRSLLTFVRVVQGTLDMMVQRTGIQGEGNLIFVQNNFYYDAFFLKAIGAYFIPVNFDRF